MIGVIDYGLGNVQAFLNIYKRLGIPAVRIVVKDDFKNVDRFILPGVGSFDHAITLLNDSGLRDTLEDKVMNKKYPVLGVCVGMQILADSSEEGKLSGLGWIPGSVLKFDDNPDFPLPHMGWNEIKINTNCYLFNNFKKDPLFYFLHSYFFKTKDPKNIISNAKYGRDFECVINKGNIYGIQCHPEKSHNNGICFLKNFSEIKC